MKCKSCGCDLSPQEKDDILTALSEGIKYPTVMCQDCINYRYEPDEDEDFEEDFEEDKGYTDFEGIF